MRRSSSAFPIRARISPGSSRAFVSPWLARKDADWRIDAALRLCARARRHHRAHDGSRARSSTSTAIRRGASLYPGQATTELVPDHDLRRRAAVSRQATSPDDGRDRRAPRASTSTPITRRSQAEIARLRQTHRRSCSTTATPFARSSRACSRANCPCSTSARMAARAATPELAARGRQPAGRERAEPRRRTAASRAAGSRAPMASPSAACTRCRWNSPAAAICGSPPAPRSRRDERGPTRLRRKSAEPLSKPALNACIPAKRRDRLRQRLHF